MFSIENLIPITFPALAIAHFIALLSPGPDFFLLAGHGIRSRFWGSAFISLGIALGNAVYIIISISGWSTIRDNPVLFRCIEVAGALYLLWIGYRLLTSRSRSIDLTKQSHPTLSIPKQCAVGFTSAILNPKNMLFYMSLMTVILGRDVTMIQQIACGVWMFGVVLVWDLLIVVLIGHPFLEKILNRKVHYIERGSGVVLMSFSIVLFVSNGL